MFKYRSKEYASSSEALDDYIRNFDFQNYENELSRKLNKTIHNANDREFSKTCDSNTNRQKTTTNTLKSSLLSKNSENLIEIGEEKSEFNANEDDLAIKKIESLINVLSNRIDEHKKNNNNAFTCNFEEVNYNEMKQINELQMNTINQPGVKVLDMKIKDDLDATNKQAESIKDSLFVFESINKKFNETNNNRNKITNELQMPPVSTVSTSESKTNFINECMKLIDTDELLKFPTLAQLAQTTTGLYQKNDQHGSTMVNSSNTNVKFNDSGLDCLLNEIKGALK